MTTTEDERLTAFVAAYRKLEHAADDAANDEEKWGVHAQIRALAREFRASRWEPYPWQHPHVHPPGWKSSRAPGVCDESCYTLPRVKIPAQGMWLELGGRGTGKTEGASHYVNRHVLGPPCDTRLAGGHKMLIVGPTQGDAVDACVTGISGLQTINPGVTITTSKGGTWVRWPNGARARILGASTPEDVERLRAAGNNCLAWMEELAAMRRLREALQHIRFGLRVGPSAHFVGSTTPKKRPELYGDHEQGGLVHDPLVVQTKGRTRDAVRLPEETRRFYEDRYAGTYVGRQELDAEELSDVEGALWVTFRPEVLENGELNPDDRPGIENDRVRAEELGGWTPHDTVEDRFGIPTPTPAPVNATIRVERVVVGVDPAGGRTENGIVVVGAVGNHGYVLDDLSLRAGPDAWGKVAVLAYLDYGAEGIALERTYGGDQTEHVIQTAAEALGVPMPPILKAPTAEGKKQRALPLVALSQQHRFHLPRPGLPLLESEMTTWVEEEESSTGTGTRVTESPNRLDAMVHAARHLLVRARPGKVGQPARSRTRFNPAV